jgi:hypothetical protein
MSFFDFNYPEPSDLVDLQNNLNDNWDDLDIKLNQLRFRPFPVANFSEVPVGMEGYYPEGGSDTDGRLSVYTGSIWRRAGSQRLSWQNWVNLEPYLVSGRSFRAGFPPQARYNTSLRKVELQGSVRFNPAGDAWATSATATLRIPYSVFNPPHVNVLSGFIAPVDHTVAEASEGVRSARMLVVRDDDEEWTQITTFWQGDVLDTNSNSVYLDGMFWWAD